jgi:hypothetical protein
LRLAIKARRSLSRAGLLLDGDSKVSNLQGCFQW